CVSPLLAQSRQVETSPVCPLLGAKRSAPGDRQRVDGARRPHVRSGHVPTWSASGRRGAVADDERTWESDSAIVAGKPTNKAERSAAGPVERRAEAKGNVSQQSTGRARWSAYGKSQSQGRRRSSPLSYTISVSICLTRRSRRLRRTRQRAW